MLTGLSPVSHVRSEAESFIASVDAIAFSGRRNDTGPIAVRDSAPSRDFTVRVMLWDALDSTVLVSSSICDARPRLPSAVVLRIRAGSVRTLAHLVEKELGLVHGLFYCITAFQFGPYSGEGPWHAMPLPPPDNSDTVDDSDTAEDSHQPQPPDDVVSTVTSRHPAAVDALGMNSIPRPSPLKSVIDAAPSVRVGCSRLIDRLPPSFAMKIVPGARRLSMLITLILPPAERRTHYNLDGPGIVQRRAAALITTLRSLYRAVSSALHVDVVPERHLLLLQNRSQSDGSVFYDIVQSAAQLGAFSIILVDLGHHWSRLPSLVEEMQEQRILPEDLNPSGATEHGTIEEYEASLKKPPRTVEPDLRSHPYDVTDTYVRVPRGVPGGEGVVVKPHKPSRQESVRAAIDGSGPPLRDTMIPSLRFRVPARVQTPAAPSNIQSTLQGEGHGAKGDASRPAADAHREEADESSSEDAFIRDVIGLRQQYVDAVIPQRRPMAALGVASTTTADASTEDREGDSESSMADLEPLDMTYTAIAEGVARFPSTRTVVKTPSNGGAIVGGPRANFEPTSRQQERKLLIRDAMHMLMRHPDRDMFDFVTLSRILSDAVQSFSRMYPQDVSIRFPLSRNDEDKLRELIEKGIRMEINDVIQDDDWVPFVPSALVERRVERARLRHQQKHGSQGKPQPLVQPNFASFSPDRARALEGEILKATEKNQESDHHLFESSPTSGDGHRSLGKRRGKIVMTHPQYVHKTNQIVVYVTTDIDIFETESPAQVTARLAKTQTLAQTRDQAATRPLPYRWFIVTGGNKELHRGHTALSASDVALDAMIETGVAKLDVISFAPPVTLSLTLDLVREDGHKKLWTRALQVGKPYCVGITIADAHGRTVTVMEPFSVPESLLPEGVTLPTSSSPAAATHQTPATTTPYKRTPTEL